MLSQLFPVVMSSQAAFKIRYRQRSVKIIALCDIAAVRLQQLDLLPCLNALRNTFKPHSLCHCHNVLEHHRFLVVKLVLIERKEALVHLEHIPRDILYQCKRGIADTEIVHRGRYPGSLQSADDPLQILEFNVCGRLSKLYLYVLMRYIVPVNYPNDMLQQMCVRKMPP